MQTWQFIVQNYPQVLELTFEHLWLVLVSTALAVVVGIPLGILITRRPLLNKPVLGLANVIQTIPSLALFGILLPAPWIGARADRLAILALTLYALLPMIRNTYVGIKSVDRAIIEAGRGMGMTDHQLLWQVELPLSLGVIVAGVRVATVISVGLATIAAAIGAGGLGHIGIQVLKALCAAEIIVLDRAPGALELATNCGADHVVRADGNEVEAVLSLTGGRGAEAVIDFVGSSATVNLAVASITKGGTIVVVVWLRNRYA